MRSAGLIFGCAIVVALLTGWALRRLGFAWAVWITLVAGILARLAAGVVFAWTAVRAAERGGSWFIALSVALGVIAAGSFAINGFMVWGLLKFGADGES